MSATMWTSKLGNKYLMSEIQQNDPSSQRELKRLRGLKGNTLCADCGRQDNTWASVTHGVFICVICSDVHRSVGTHITKVKGCTGTYLWGPDELQKMQVMGNLHAEKVYGADKVSPSASKEQKQQFLVKKYEERSFAGKSTGMHSMPEKLDRATVAKQEPLPVVRQAESAPGNAKPVPIQKTQHAAQIEAKTTPAIAREMTIPDNLFDEFFNEAEDSYLCSPVLEKTHFVEPTDGGLDAFLNTTLSAEPQKKMESGAGYPIHLDPFQKDQTKALADVFADWPEF